MKQGKYILCALLAALLYALSTPFSKVLLNHLSSTMMAAFLYLGAGVGVAVLWLLRPDKAEIRKTDLTKKDLPYTLGMILLDIAAPVCMMAGLSRATAANASLLNNFEIVATSLIAFLVFREPVSKRLWAAIGLITAASLLLSFEDASSLTFSLGSLFVLLACVCWGLENNCTRAIAERNIYEIVILKGLFSGLGSLLIALARHEPVPALRYIILTMLLGFFAYGLSVFVYIVAQKGLGAAKTSAYYAVSPFVAAGLSLAVLHEPVDLNYLAALLLMIGGTALVTADTLLIHHNHRHTHVVTEIIDGKEVTHTIEHSHPHYHTVDHPSDHHHHHIGLHGI